MILEIEINNPFKKKECNKEFLRRLTKKHNLLKGIPRPYRQHKRGHRTLNSKRGNRWFERESDLMVHIEHLEEREFPGHVIHNNIDGFRCGWNTRDNRQRKSKVILFNLWNVIIIKKANSGYVI